ncbi:MAG: thiamine diphosphokinase [Lachnospiraceae bacterium]|nr:thiamine diphosphokinase [Lachnospiraceae bacterium]
MKKCVIVGAGECSIQKLKEQLVLDSEDLCIAADGGMDYLLKAGVRPDMVLGDMDSVREAEILGQFPVKKLPVEKDDTDMLAAVKEGLASGYESFELYGALGGRLDHTIANIQCLLYLMNRGARGTIIGDMERLLLIRNEKILFRAGDYEKGRRLSVFAFGGDAYGVSETGLKYVLDDVTLKQEFPIGISNEFAGTDAVIEVKNGMLLLCIAENCCNLF